jgi:hypothetical protein
LDFAGTLVVNWPFDIAKCAGYSMTATLVPGDSVVGYDIMRVDSPPGTYALQVRHALEPEAWYVVRVRVTE